MLFKNGSNVQYSVKASAMEIHCKELLDLLSDERKNLHIMSADSDPSSTKIIIPDLTCTEVKSAERLHELMRVVLSKRATAATAGNAVCSRSHLIGSESGATSKDMKETASINTSLNALKDMIVALTNKEYVPFRRSLLTRLLKPSLSGNSKTLMICNLSPFRENFSESVNSMRFASIISDVKIGAKRNETK